jgi:hypothetical protein
MESLTGQLNSTVLRLDINSCAWRETLMPLSGHRVRGRWHNRPSTSRGSK